MLNNKYVTLIAAKSTNNVIGLNNGIPWILKGDMMFFKENTIAKTVVMGRKTFESLPFALPQRKNVIITKQPQEAIEQLKNYDTSRWIVTASSMEDAVHKCRDDLFFLVIGGGEIYKDFMPYADELLITEVDAVIEGDEDELVYFP